MNAVLLIQRDKDAPAHFVQPHGAEPRRLSLCGLFETTEQDMKGGIVRYFRGTSATCAECIRLAGQ